jgi:putative ubiquitin-RnfH superfamily antitoxin RatB of RatAB toxin-antitoxin module
MAAIRVEVVYALADRAESVEVRLPAGATAAEAVKASGLAARHPGMNTESIGVFGRRVSPQTRLADGDRVEIYRPLVLDPKEARRRRARGKR